MADNLIWTLVSMAVVTISSFGAGYYYARMTESKRRLRESKAKLREMLGDG